MTPRPVLTSSLVPAAVLALSAIAWAQSPPVCDNGGPYTGFECNGPATVIPMDGSASFDPDGTPVSFFWFEECPFGFIDDPTSATPNFIIDMVGVCSRACGPFPLRVTSGGETVACLTFASAQDTTAPAITCPADIDICWGDSTDPSNTGMASATDACNPSPSLTSSDVIIPQQGPGVEQTIIRTWTADDGCQTSSCDQTIRLLSPWVCGTNLEYDPGNCANAFNRKTRQREVQLTLLGTDTLDLAELDFASLVLRRMDGSGSAVAPHASAAPQDVLQATAATVADCNPLGQDARADVTLTFVRGEFIRRLGLQSLPNGAEVEIVLSGALLSGTPFRAAERIVLVDKLGLK